jgi:hypothetical protein
VYSLAQAFCSDQLIVKSSISITLKRVSQSLHFQTGAEQRKQAPYEHDSAFGRQENVGIPLQSRKVPENDDSEQRAAENKTEAAEKQENMIQEKVRASKRDWHVQNSAPVRDLHHAENTKADNA